MGESTPRRSEVVPYLSAALLCDVAAVDPSSKKPTLVGVFDNINALRFPTERAVTLYFKITDAEGHYDISVKYMRVSDGSLIAEAVGRIDAADRNLSYGMNVPFPPLPIPEEGRYEFQVWANDVYLGSASLLARRMQPQPRESGEV